MGCFDHAISVPFAAGEDRNYRTIVFRIVISVDQTLRYEPEKLDLGSIRPGDLVKRTFTVFGQSNADLQSLAFDSPSALALEVARTGKRDDGAVFATIDLTYRGADVPLLQEIVPRLQGKRLPEYSLEISAIPSKPIVVSPSTLAFGKVLAGRTYKRSFEMRSHLPISVPPDLSVPNGLRFAFNRKDSNTVLGEATLAPTGTGVVTHSENLSIDMDGVRHALPVKCIWISSIKEQHP